MAPGGIYPRRTLLKGAAALAVAAPVLWRQSNAAAASPVGPQWIAFGPHPRTQMWVSWSAGSAAGPSQRPSAPRIRWGHTTSYGNVKPADSSEQVPMPSGPAMEPSEHTFYNHVLLSGLVAGGNYHYSVSNDGVTWGPDTTFSTAAAGQPDFRFTAFGDEAVSATTARPMAALVASLKPAFHLVAGDLAYTTPEPMSYPDVTGFDPGQWDNYLNVVGPAAAQSVPWMASVGAHEIEPLGNHGYDGFVTRFPYNYDPTSGSPVVYTFTYGNVGVVHLDGNELSAQETINTGYSQGAQTAWLKKTLSAYRASASGTDFIVVVCNCCCYSSNTKHGSDGGLRDVWGPLFDHYKVDLVISGHVHAYERTNPMIAGKPTRTVAAGGTVHPASDGTTYINAGGGGNGLYTAWYGATGGGDTGSSTQPKIWRWSGGDTATGGSGSPKNVTDTAKGFSAFRRAAFSCLCVDVTAPDNSGKTKMLVRAMMPTQTSSAVTSIATPKVMDSVSIVRTRA